MSDAFSTSTHQLRILLPGLKNGICRTSVEMTGDPQTDAANVQAWIAGVPVYLSGDLQLSIADGAIHPVLGLLVYDAAGTSPWDGIGGVAADGKVTFIYAKALVGVPNRVLTTEAFIPGDVLYAGTGANLGLLTRTSPAATATAIATVLSVAEQAQDGLLAQMII
jgi:hypothetical protein